MPAGQRRVACLDVGGTAVKSVVLEEDRPVGRHQEPTPRGEGGVDALIDLLAKRVSVLGEQHGPLDAVGLVVPGVVDSDRGVAVWSENLGWREEPLAGRLAQRVDLPVAFGHDVRAGGLAEARLGAGRDLEDFAFLPIGTGIAAAIVCGGEVYDRPRPIGEIGHVDVGHPGRCVCGLTGCLEAVASAAAIERAYGHRTGVHASAEEIAARVATGGDPDAEQVWNEAVDALARGIAWLAAVLAPQAVVVGGGLAESGDLLLEPLRAAVDRRITFHHRPRIIGSAFGDLAGCVGAGLLARDALAAGR